MLARSRQDQLPQRQWIRLVMCGHMVCIRQRLSLTAAAIGHQIYGQAAGSTSAHVGVIGVGSGGAAGVLGMAASGPGMYGYSGTGRVFRESRQVAGHIWVWSGTPEVRGICVLTGPRWGQGSMTITSSALVTNLNADRLDSKHASDFVQVASGLALATTSMSWITPRRPTRQLARVGSCCDQCRRRGMASLLYLRIYTYALIIKNKKLQVQVGLDPIGQLVIIQMIESQFGLMKVVVKIKKVSL